MVPKTTIIIPTYNRPRQLERLLDYYSKYNFPIIVSDSSSEKFKNISKYKKVKYYHYKDYPYTKKLALTYQKIKTKYSVFCGDDDFVVPESIKECGNFLEKNPDYSSAHGHYLFFEDSNDKKIEFEPWYLYSIGLHIDSDIPSVRLQQLLGKYKQLLYAVTRTKDIKTVSKCITNYKISNDNLIELLQASILCVYGKSIILPVLYCVRERTPGSAGVRVDGMEIIATKKSYRKEYQRWVNSIADQLAIKEKLSNKKAKKKFNTALNMYLNKIVIKTPLYNINLSKIKWYINHFTCGLAVKIRDLTTTPENIRNKPAHAVYTKKGKLLKNRVLKYILKYQK